VEVLCGTIRKIKVVEKKKGEKEYLPVHTPKGYYATEDDEAGYEKSSVNYIALHVYTVSV